MDGFFVKYRNKRGCLSMRFVEAIGQDREGSIWFEDLFEKIWTSDVITSEERFEEILSGILQTGVTDLSDTEEFGSFDL